MSPTPAAAANSAGLSGHPFFVFPKHPIYDEDTEGTKRNHDKQKNCLDRLRGFIFSNLCAEYAAEEVKGSANKK